MNSAVFDSSSLIFCLKIPRLLEVARRRFGELFVPASVLEEVRKGGKKSEAPEVPLLEELLAKGVFRNASAKPLPYGSIGRGEAEALAVALAKKAFCLSDDRKAWSAGNASGVKVLSMPAMLIACCRKKMIEKKEAAGLVERLVSEGYYLKATDYLEIIKAIDNA